MNLNEKNFSVEMEEIKEDVCIPCLNKSDIREVLNRLETIDEHQNRIDQRLMAIEEYERVAMRRMQDVLIMQRRNFNKMMDGFKAIQKAFHMACGAVVDLDDEMCEHMGVCKI